jgi:hypothetical protein
VNSSHGSQATFGVPLNSLKPNPNTGTLDSKQMFELEAHIDRMTNKGAPYAPGQIPDASWGAATLEGMHHRNKLSSEARRALFPSASEAAQLTQEELQGIEDTREFWNGWLQQRLEMFKDIVRMLQDESTGGQSAKDRNKELLLALRTHLNTRAEGIATMMGYDAFSTGPSYSPVSPEMLWKYWLNGNLDRLIVLNRSGLIADNNPVKNYTDYGPILRSVTFPNGKTAELSPGTWS